MATVNQDEIKKTFNYTNGLLTWAIRPANCVHIGDKAGYLDNNGYLRVKFKGKLWLVHQLVFLMHNGYIPKMIDHIDQNKTNNCIENLRPVTKAENTYNCKARSNNISGVKNVHWNKRFGKYFVKLKSNGVMHHFGAYKDLELAELVAIEARNKFHQQFAYLGD
jgi:hypothetical protein